MGQPRKAKAVAKGTAKRTSIARLFQKCQFCPNHPIANSYYCESCGKDFEEFRGVLGGGASDEQVYRVFRFLLTRIEDLENSIEMERIREKYTR